MLYPFWRSFAAKAAASSWFDTSLKSPPMCIKNFAGTSGVFSNARRPFLLTITRPLSPAVSLGFREVRSRTLPGAAGGAYFSGMGFHTSSARVV